ncbi:Protein CSN12-like protein [Talaromyces atroroseus]|uniref:Protein CSN12-like protein n=1 Tax=Talaromyces atroroseus TaxID=1441469 RepID=A0A225ADX0_TALAT|nr:Protein CSN12-like protein [Talaromyces atroroseus]OKL59401.1 Protein CSN12-like protein [Talaromyces atroroseus]
MAPSYPFADFKAAFALQSGPLLAAVFTPESPPEDPYRLEDFRNFSNPVNAEGDIRRYLLQDKHTGVKLNKPQGHAWVNVVNAYWAAIGELNKAYVYGTWLKALEAWKEFVNHVIRGYSNNHFPAWTIPLLYVAGKYLRAFAMKADASVASQNDGGFGNGFQEDVVSNNDKNANLEDAARIINRMFTLCLGDRAPIEESRKWGIYETTNLLFKTYFKLNQVGLSKSVLRALDASSADIPGPEQFPKSHIVTFNYYVGVINFLEENYKEAEESLTQAWLMCKRDAWKNRELILTYLIPCHLVTTHRLPSKNLLGPFPRLNQLLRPLCDCIRQGNLVGFDAAMSAGADEFVKRRIYLPLERGRDLALRNLFRKVFIAGGFEPAKDGQPPIRRTRVPLTEFAAALRIGTKADEKVRVDMDEVECLLANMIYKSMELMNSPFDTPDFPLTYTIMEGMASCSADAQT